MTWTHRFDPNATRLAFGLHDKVSIDGIEYRPNRFNEIGWLMTNATSGLSKQFPHEELDRLSRTGRIVRDPDHHHPDGQQRRACIPGFRFDALPPPARARWQKASAYVAAFLAAEAEGSVRRTDASIASAMRTLRGDALARMGQLALTFGTSPPPSANVAVTPSSRTLRRWVVAFERGGEMALVDRTNERGCRRKLLAPDVQEILARGVEAYLSPDRPPQTHVLERIRAEVAALNEERAETGLDPLDAPSRETVRREIAKVDPYIQCLAREGADAARKRFAAVRTGLDCTRPLERVEIDEWTVDLMTLMASTGLLGILSAQELAALGLDGSRKRMTLTVAICCATRCIVGMTLSLTPNARAALHTLQMACSDKGAWTDGGIDFGPWDMGGVPEEVVSDCGTAFVSEEFRLALATLKCRAKNTAAGVPELRGTIERLFGTMSRDFCARLTGRTFASTLEKGDAEPADRAALTIDDLCYALVRWVVDFYHNQPHRGLDHDTPLERWRSATALYGRPCYLDSRRRRIVFGERSTCTLDKTGLEVLGVRYHSEELAEHMRRSRRRNMDVRWHSEDLGTIEVLFDDGWCPVPAITEGLAAVSAESWMAALRRSGPPARSGRRDVHSQDVAEAARAIEDRSRQASAAKRLVSIPWTEERRAAAHAEVSARWTFQDRRPAAAEAGPAGRSVLVPPPAGRGAPPEPEDPAAPRAGFRTEEY